MKSAGFLALGGFILGTVFAPLAAQEEAEDVVSAPAPTAEGSGNLFSEQRKSYLGLLARDVEANLPTKDVQKLNQNVQRLGSYRFEWSKSARDFLLANMPVAELILYRYSTYKNPELSSRILDTLAVFETFRYPPAAIAFAEVLGVDRDSKIKSLGLMARAVSQDPSLTNDAISLLSSPWGQEVPAVEKLYFMTRACGVWRKSTSSLPNSFAQWSTEAQNFWGRVLAEEVTACQKGI